MTGSFSLYIDQPSGLHSLHPLTKLLLTGFCLIAGLFLPWTWGSYLVFFVLVLPLAAWGRVLRPLVRDAIKAVLPFAISLFLIQGFLWTGGDVLWRIGPLSLKEEGVVFSVISVGRILMIVSSLLLLVLSTRPDALMKALDERGVPKSLTYIVLSTIQIVPRFQARAAAIADAQRSRGLETEGNISQRIRGLLPLVVPLVLGSIIDIEERAIALEARGFSRQGRKTSLLILHDTAWQRVARWLLFLAMVVLLGLRLWFLI